MVATLKAVKAAAEKIGAKVSDDKTGYDHTCRVEAPANKFWNEGVVHEIVESANQPWKPDYDLILKRMSYGLSDCIDPECDWCHPLPEHM